MGVISMFDIMLMSEVSRNMVLFVNMGEMFIRCVFMWFNVVVCKVLL